MESDRIEEADTSATGRYKKLKFTLSELSEITSKTLADLIVSDSLLNYLPPDPTLDEINSQIALHHGQSMTVYVLRDTEDKLPIVVNHNATVGDFKKAIRRYISLNLKRRKDPTVLNWSHVWRKHILKSDYIVLGDNRTKLSEYGVTNGSVVTFGKKYRKVNYEIFKSQEKMY